MAASFKVVTNSQALVVTAVTTPAGAAVAVFDSVELSSEVTLPDGIIADTTYYVASPGWLLVAVAQADGTSLGVHYTCPTGAATETIVPLPSRLQIAAETTVGWDDLRVSLSRATTGANNPSLTAFQGGTQCYAFSKTATNQLFFDVQLPHNWIAGSEIRPHIHWSPGNSAHTGSVRWQLEHTWGAINGAFPSATVADPVDQAAAGAYKHQIADLGHIAGTGKGVSSVLMCRVARLGAADEDTFDAVAFGLSVDFHIQISGNGTLDEYPT